MEAKETYLLTDVFRAYYDARHNKRNTYSQLRFEMDLEKNLLSLYHEINDRSYRVGKSICFIVYKPVQREIFAAEFKDRVVHHLLYNYIAGILEKTFIEDSYSCRIGKGTSKGVERLEHHIRSCSNNYTQMAYVLKMDIQGFFMNINRQLLFEKVCNVLEKQIKKSKRSRDTINRGDFDMELIKFLLKEILFNDPTQNCFVKGNLSDWDGLPHSKSLFYSPSGVGLPIGNLTSQLFSNVFLNELDQYIKRGLGAKHYGRYVDDFYIVHQEREVLLEYKNIIRDFLKDRLGLIMHPRKIYLQTIYNGVSFLGVMLKPYRRYVNSKTKGRFIKYISQTEALLKVNSCLSKEECKHTQASINSYLGYMDRYKTFEIRRKALSNCPQLSCYGAFDFNLSRYKLIDLL